MKFTREVSILCVLAIAVARVSTERPPRTVTFLHTNDHHAHIESMDEFGSGSCNSSIEECFGGYPRLKTYIDEIKDTADHPVVYLDIGDMFQGTIWTTYFRGQAMADLRRLLAPAAMTLGNHEFDYGPETLANFIGNLTFPVVVCNLDVSNEESMDPSMFQSSMVLSLENGLNVGVVGWITPDTAFLAMPGNVTFLDPVEPVQAEINKLLASGVDLVVGLSHIGYNKDLQLAGALKGIDIILGGHSHTILTNSTGPPPVPAVYAPWGPYPTVATSLDGRPVYIAQAFWSGWYVGRLTVNVHQNGAKDIDPTSAPQFMDSAIPENREMLAAMDPYLRMLGNQRFRVIGTSTARMPGDPVTLRMGEAALGNFLTDSLLYYMKTNKPGMLQAFGENCIAIWNSGGIRAGLSSGQIVANDIKNVLPFDGVFSVLSLNGTTLLDALEHAVSGIERLKGRLLQVSGIQYGYQSTPEGPRLVFANLVREDGTTERVHRGQNKYTVILPEYVASGGNGFDMLPGTDVILEFGSPLTDVILEVIEDLRVVDYPPESVGDRIIDCGAEPMKCEDAMSATSAVTHPISHKDLPSQESSKSYVSSASMLFVLASVEMVSCLFTFI